MVPQTESELADVFISTVQAIEKAARDYDAMQARLIEVEALLLEADGKAATAQARLVEAEAKATAAEAKEKDMKQKAIQCEEELSGVKAELEAVKLRKNLGIDKDQAQCASGDSIEQEPELPIAAKPKPVKKLRWADHEAELAQLRKVIHQLVEELREQSVYEDAMRALQELEAQRAKAETDARVQAIELRRAWEGKLEMNWSWDPVKVERFFPVAAWETKLIHENMRLWDEVLELRATPTFETQPELLSNQGELGSRDETCDQLEERQRRAFLEDERNKMRDHLRKSYKIGTSSSGPASLEPDPEATVESLLNSVKEKNETILSLRQEMDAQKMLDLEITSYLDYAYGLHKELGTLKLENKRLLLAIEQPWMRTWIRREDGKFIIPPTPREKKLMYEIARVKKELEEVKKLLPVEEPEMSVDEVEAEETGETDLDAEVSKPKRKKRGFFKKLMCYSKRK